MKKLFSLILVILMTLFTLSAQTSSSNYIDLVGYASVGDGTTGGEGGVAYNVSTGDEIAAFIKQKKDGVITQPLTLVVIDTITPDNTSESNVYIKGVSDVTLIGQGTLGTLAGIGISVVDASNIIIRNLSIYKVLEGNKDGIGIEDADHIWVDHCELFAEFDNVDKDYYDGLLDAKGESEYLTYSWNVFHDSWKMMLCGSSDGDVYDRKLTMHHNYFYNVNSRMPLFRGGTAHVFNNYYKDVASSGINSRVNACVKIENNYFDGVHNAYVSAYSSVVGYAEITGNEEVNCTWDFSRDDVSELTACTPTIPYDYTDYLDDATNIPSIVQLYAGVGKIDEVPTSYPLDIMIVGEGSVSPPGGEKMSESEVSLTAIAAHGFVFSAWSGDVNSSENPLTISMDSAISLTATFVEAPTYNLTTGVDGSGTISIIPDTTNGTYFEGETVTLTASPAALNAFSEWTGDISSTSNPLELIITGDISVTANFIEVGTGSTVTYQPEDACPGYSFNPSEGEISTKHDGYTGNGFIDLANNEGSYIDYAVDADGSQAATIIVRYANGGGDARTMDLKLNGTVVANLSFDATSAWTTWEELNTSITLAKGKNKFSFVATDATGGPNIDKVTIESTAIAFGDCSFVPGDTTNPGDTIDPGDTTTNVHTRINSSSWLQVYPNPVTENSRVIINLPETSAYTLTLYDFTGRVIMNKIGESIANTEIILSIESNSLSTGMYLMELKAGNTRITKKLIVR